MPEYESESVNIAAGELRFRAKAVVGDISSQKEEAFNIGIAPQTLNNWLNYSDLPAFALSKMKCGRIILAYLENEWNKNFGGRVQTSNLTDIVVEITEHIGIISNIVRNSPDLTQKHSAIQQLKELKELINMFESEVQRILK